jgi:hypothetical protein
VFCPLSLDLPGSVVHDSKLQENRYVAEENRVLELHYPHLVVHLSSMGRTAKAL